MCCYIFIFYTNCVCFEMGYYLSQCGYRKRTETFRSQALRINLKAFWSTFNHYPLKINIIAENVIISEQTVF